MESRASDKRRVRVIIRTALLIVSACFIGLTWADAAGARTLPHSVFTERFKKGRAEAGRFGESRRFVSGYGKRG